LRRNQHADMAENGILDYGDDTSQYYDTLSYITTLKPAASWSEFAARACDGCPLPGSDRKSALIFIGSDF
jgi:hypothetical protein